jgi:serine/threonine protein kinase/tetratricopeptide (TPR) repeat protein
MAAWTPGVPLGPYLLLAPIGAGGMGEVWKARDTRLDRIVAVKRLKGQQVSASGKARFEQEARAIAALNHPNICTLHDVGPDYLVMEFIEGHSPSGPLPLSDALALAAQIADALMEAHAHGILHRDLKPANILITAKGTVKLLDFGLAKITMDSAATQTQSGAILGTPLYMSPEQAEGKPLDARSDIFSFGAVLYEILTGVRAFDSLAALLRDSPAPLQSPAAELVMRCLAKQPSGRFQSMEDVKVALQNVGLKPPEQHQPSIAVLPFANMSRDADDEYFSDGLAEEILNVLAQVSGLKVIARTSAFAFKGKNEDVRGIAEALGVTNILEGSVRRAGSRIRITAQLIHAADGSHLWSQRYDRELTDVFAVQDEIAVAIAGALRLKLIGKPATARPHQPNLPAYEAFLKGSQQYSVFSPEAFARAEEYFKQAIALDPQWAEPHSALARQYFTLGNNALRPLSEMVPLARAEAFKALELLPSEPGAHAVLGGIAAVHDYDWKEAEDQFRMAREVETSTPEVCAWYATFYLVPLGRFEEAIEEGTKSVAHDPLNSFSHMNQSLTLVFAGLYERAIEAAQRALALDDRSFLAPLVIALGEFHQGKHAQARKQAEEAFRIAPWHPMVVGFLAGVLAQDGEKQRAEELIAKMPDGAVLYRMLGSQIDAAIDAYAQVIEARHPVAAMMAAAKLFEPLRSSPRWPRLAKMMNLPGV